MNGENTAYFDNNATTEPTRTVVEAIVPFLAGHYGNPSSPHHLARSPALAIAEARTSVARLCGAAPEQVVFTSGGTESNAMALLGWLASAGKRRRVVMSAVEHVSIWGWRSRLTDMGHEVRVIPCHRSGGLDLGAAEKMINEETALVAVMASNNENGVRFPVEEIGTWAKQAGARMHVDVSQSAGKVPLDLAGTGIDSASLCAHKFHGAKGVGALYLANREGFRPWMTGGGQEQGLRPGTEAVALLAGMGQAAKEAEAWLASGGPGRLGALRDQFESWLEAEVEGIEILGKNEPRLPNTTLLFCGGAETEPLLALLDMDGIACSSGSACASGAHEPSHVLRAMGVDPAGGAVVRITSSRLTHPEDYRRLREVLPGRLRELRQRLARPSAPGGGII